MRHEPMEDALRLGRAIRERRKLLGMTQEELAALAGCGRLLINKLEQGQASPRLASLLDVLEALGLQITLEAGRNRLEAKIDAGG